ncbi:unnamed protein product [Brassica rapa]|uniref:Uncharacterized protein n=2 Tax=Brassica TaxID=3705 RepID=A0A8D9HF28_BRACM|nr:unnamed protein product [Brassica napus]CAG7898025.1 unnamed protein product [Brassica rapa]
MDLSLLSSSSLIWFLRRKFLMKETPLMILEPLGPFTFTGNYSSNKSMYIHKLIDRHVHKS